MALQRKLIKPCYQCYGPYRRNTSLIGKTISTKSFMLIIALGTVPPASPHITSCLAESQGYQ